MKRQIHILHLDDLYVFTYSDTLIHKIVRQRSDGQYPVETSFEELDEVIQLKFSAKVLQNDNR